MALGGVPSRVPKPPRVAAIGMPNNKALTMPDLEPIATGKGVMAAITTAEAAVLGIYLEISMVVNIRPVSSSWDQYLLLFLIEF